MRKFDPYPPGTIPCLIASHRTPMFTVRFGDIFQESSRYAAYVCHLIAGVDDGLLVTKNESGPPTLLTPPGTLDEIGLSRTWANPVFAPEVPATSVKAPVYVYAPFALRGWKKVISGCWN